MLTCVTDSMDPNFIRFRNTKIWNPPGILEKTNIQSFFVKGNFSKSSWTVDKYLNINEKYYFEALSEYVMIIYLHTGRESSLDKEFAKRGKTST